MLVRLDHIAHFVVNANHSFPIRLAKLAPVLSNSAHMKTTTLPLKHSVNRVPCQLALLISLALVCFGLSPTSRADDCVQGCDFLYNNTILGQEALKNYVEGGFSNTAVGFYALNANTIGDDNTATGAGALQLNTTGFDNTANGLIALHFNTTGSNNTATGSSALLNNTTGIANTATGVNALLSNTTGNNNTAHGAFALKSNTTGVSNTANGWQALFGNTTGNNNTAVGLDALLSNTTGLNNTASGVLALGFNTTGSSNTATGISALQNNSTGGNNTATGAYSLSQNYTGSSNIALGFQAGMNVTGNNNIEIGNVGVAGDNNKIRIGTKATHKNTYIAGIFGVTAPTGIGVLIDNSGHLGTTTSSARFKEAIKPMGKASEAILSLEPVTFRYKEELDPTAIPQFGLVAEEVEKVNPDLVARDDEGKPYTVRYEAVNAMLLNEFLKEHRKVEEQSGKQQKLEATVAQQQKEIRDLTTVLKVQAAQIQKVSDQLKVQALTPRVVANN